MFERIKNIFRKEIKNEVGNDKILSYYDLFATGENLQTNALNEVTYYVCLKFLSEAIGKLTLHLYDLNNEKVSNHKLYEVFNVRPNEIMTPSNFKQVVEYNRNHFGNSYIFIYRDKKGIKLFPLDTNSVRVIINDGNDNIPRIVYEIKNNKKVTYLKPEEIIHLKGGLSADGILGKSVKDTLLTTFAVAKESDKVLEKTLKRGLSAKGIVNINQDLSSEKRDKLIEIINKNLRNNGNRDLISLPFGVSITPLSEKMTDNQFLELKNYTANQIASAFGISPTYLNDYTKSSYSNSEAQNLSFYINTLLPILKQYEEEFDYKLLTESERKKGLHFKFNIGGILRGDLKSQAEAIRSLVGAGVYTINEARTLLDKPKLEEGDTPIVNGSYVKLKDIGIAYSNKGGDVDVENNQSE